MYNNTFIYIYIYIYIYMFKFNFFYSIKEEPVTTQVSAMKD